jgi:hypothetical protein
MSGRYHRTSTFGPGRRARLDHAQRVRVRFLLHHHHRNRRLTRAQRDIGLTYLRHHGTTGRCDPSRATVAREATCSVRTVDRANEALRVLGLLRWQRRIVRIGNVVEQTSNAYELIPADPPPHAKPSEGHAATGTKPFDKSNGLLSFYLPGTAETFEAQSALARIRARLEGKLLRDGSARRRRAPSLAEEQPH